MVHRITTQMSICMNRLARVVAKAIQDHRSDVSVDVTDILLDLHSPARWYFRERAKPILDRLIEQHEAADGPSVAAVRRAIAEAIQRGAPRDLKVNLRQGTIEVKGGAEGQLCDDSGADLFEVIANFVPKPAATCPTQGGPTVAHVIERFDTLVGELMFIRDQLRDRTNP